ncbi:Gfo/Idh/MocA family oxidoreductase [bacterium]|nr:MAG: Gfo/Idh/MocA family oxidoreductase [bacterium]
MKTVRFAIVGTGNIAVFHARAIEMVEGAELVAVHSRRAPTGQKFASEYGAEYVSDYTALLERDDIDAIAITTPSGTHADLGIQAAKAGKHVLCEKPIDITPARIDELVEACRENKVQLGAIFQSRFGPGAQALKKAVEAGRFGKLAQCAAYVPWYRSQEYYASAGWRGTWELDGGGALMNQSIHAIDLLLWLAGDVSEVSARCGTALHDNIEVEDNAVAWLSFKNGAFGVVQGSTACYPGESKRIEIKGSTGSVTLVDDMPTFWQFETESPEDEAVRALVQSAQIGGGASNPTAISNEGHRAQYEDFVGAILEKREPAIPGSDGRKAVELICAIYESSRKNSIVTL